jgi:CheY-like chemotaxis protein
MEPKTRILIVEDDAIVGLVLTEQLKGLGFDVVALARTGDESLRAAEDSTPDLALVDIGLVGAMDGTDAASRLRADFGIPVIFITARTDAATLARAKLSEPYGYLVKPFDPRELGVTIEMALFKHAAEEERRRLLQELQEALAKVKILTGLLPICRGCKKIRDDSGYWNQVEIFLAQQTEATFSHGFCPQCAEKWPAQDSKTAG